MQTYTIYAPIDENRPLIERAMNYQFIKEGFSLWAALFGPLWLLAKGLWLETLAFFAAAIGLTLILQLIGFNEAAISAAMTGTTIIFGFFARDIERLHYERSGFKLISVVNGKTKDECEARYFRSLKSNETHQTHQKAETENNHNQEV